ncbi:MAG: TetR/AcrR family transcriptional regulator [Fibrobacteria bacterium]
MISQKSGKSKKPRQRNRRGEGELLRAELLEAAMRLLEKLSPGTQFSLRAVAKEAKIAPPSVYIHFKDKDALLLAVVQELLAEQIALRHAAEEEAAKAGGGAWDRLLARSLAYVKFGLERRGHYKLLFEGQVIPRMSNPGLAYSQALLSRTTELIQIILGRGDSKHEVQASEKLGLLLWSCLHGIVSLQINKPTFIWPDALELVAQIQKSLLTANTPASVSAPGAGALSPPPASR